MKFKIEQLAIAPSHPARAHELLRLIGLTEWIQDTVIATGEADGHPAINQAHIMYNYDTMTGQEFEVLDYELGDNWLGDITDHSAVVSHVGMYCTEDELAAWTNDLTTFGLKIVQDVITVNHTNPAIAGKHSYHHRIFEARYLLGFDLKFIVRNNIGE